MPKAVQLFLIYFPSFFITAMALRSERCDMAPLCAGSQARHPRPGTPVRSVDAGGVSPRPVGERREGGGGAFYPNRGVPRPGDLVNFSVHGIDLPLGSYKCCSPGCPRVSHQPSATVEVYVGVSEAACVVL